MQLFVSTILMLILTSFFPNNVFANADKAEKPDPFYDQITRSVIRLEKDTINFIGTNQKINVGSALPVGTGFFVGHKNDFFVVTARHVANNVNLHARVPLKNVSTKKMEVFRLELPNDRWAFHKESNVDVAVMKISSPDFKKYNMKCVRYNPQEIAQHDFYQKIINPFKEVYIPGFFHAEGFELKIQRPYVRSGIISMIADEKFVKMDEKLLPNNIFIIDTKMFGGNSGSPILFFDYNENSYRFQWFLIGMVIGSDITLDLAVAVPSSDISNVIEIAKNQDITGVNFWCGPIPNSENEENLEHLPCNLLIKSTKKKLDCF